MNSESALIKSVQELETLTRALERTSVLILQMTLGGIIGSVTIPMFLVSLSRFGVDPALRASASLFAVLLVFMNLISLIRYERLHKRGDTLFEEISDELNWYLREPPAEKSSVANRTPPITVRVVLRSYTRTTDLPLIPGRFGPGIYGLVNIAVMVLASLWFLV